MDEYFLSKDEWDTLVELGVGGHKDEGVLKRIPTATKTSFTKKCVTADVPRLSLTMLISPRYNSKDHPVPFHKAQDLGKLPKKLAAEPAPDLEEAYDVSGRLNTANAPPNFGIRMMMTFRTMTMMIKRRNREMSFLVTN